MRDSAYNVSIFEPLASLLSYVLTDPLPLPLMLLLLCFAVHDYVGPLPQLVQQQQQPTEASETKQQPISFTDRL